MANFCPNCGTPLAGETKFCPSCGTPVTPAAPAPQPQQQPAYQQPAPQQPVYQQPVQPVYGQQLAPVPAKDKKKKGKGGLVALVVILLVAALGAVGYFGFRDGGWFRPSGGSDEMQTLRAYAERLEKAGNTEAAAAIYALIAKGVGGELIEKADEEIPVLGDIYEAKQFERISGGVKGGGKQ